MAIDFKKWMSRFPDLGHVITRFPVAVVLMAIFTAIIVVEGVSWRNESLDRALIGFIIAAYLSFCITIARESQGKSDKALVNIIVQIGLAVIIIALAYFSEALRLNLVMALGFALLILGNVVIWRAPRNDVKANNLHVWDFTHKIWTGAIFATIGSIIFSLGLMAIQETLKSLFGVNIRNLVNDLLLPIGYGFLAPLFWLSTVPQTDEDYSELYEEPSFVSKAVAFLGTWLLAPLSLIYALILLAYGVKIALAGSLPDGEIAVMTLPFLIIGTLTWLLLLPPFVAKKALARLFRRLWFFISLPASVLLAISVWTRISEYGLTPQRIGLVFAIIWAIGIGIWFIIGPKDKRDIRLITSSAAMLLLLGVFMADRAALASQSNRFEASLKLSGIISSEGKIIGDSRAITDMDAARKAKGALSYLRSHDGEERAEKILAKYDFTLKSGGELRDQLSELGLADVEAVSRFSSHVTYDQGESGIDIAGSDQLYGVFSATRHSLFNRNLVKNNDYLLRQDDTIVILERKGETLASFDLEEWASSLMVSDDKLVKGQAVVTIFNEKGAQVKLALDKAALGVEEEKTKPYYWGLEFYVLTKGLDEPN